MILYRAIGDKELVDPETGEKVDIVAKNPEDRMYNWMDCINDMTSNKRTRFLPTTKKILVASEKYANHLPKNGQLENAPKSKIVMIDTDMIERGTIVVPREQDDPKKEKIPRDKKIANYRKAISLAKANGDQILIEGRIPADAYVVVPPLLVDVIACLQMDIDQLEREIVQNTRELINVDYRDNQTKNKKADLIKRKKELDEEIKKELDEKRKLEDEMNAAQGREKDPFAKNIKYKDLSINTKKREIERIKEEKKRIEREERKNKDKEYYKNKVEALRAIQEKLKSALEGIQEEIMNGHGESLAEIIREGCSFSELESAFVDLYYCTDASMGEVNQGIDNAASTTRENANASDAGTAIRQMVVKKMVNSEGFKSYFDIDESLEVGKEYRVAPYGSFKLSAEEDIDFRTDKQTTPLGGSADKIFLVKKGTRLIKDSKMEELSNGDTEIEMDYCDGTSGSIVISTQRFRDIVSERIRETGIQDAEGNATPGGVVAAGEAVEAGINRNNANAIEGHDF